jgi:hypothetical protein
MPGMTADEAIHAICECAVAEVESAACSRERSASAEERVKLAFAVLEEVEATVGHGCAQHWAARVLASARARLEAKPDADEH